MQITFFAALAILATGCAEAQSPTNALESGGVPSLEGVVIAPGPEDGDAWPGEFPDWEAHPALAQARTIARSFWQGQSGGLEEEEFRVMDVAEGTFTAPGAQQQAVLYLMSTVPRCCVRMGLAVVQDGELVRHVAFEGGVQRLQAVPDLNGDGRDELVLSSSFGMGGDESSSLTLASFEEAGALRDWGRLDTGGSDCAGRGTFAQRVRVLAYPGPVFTAETFEGSCETEAWRAEGPPQPVELLPPFDDTMPGLEDYLGYRMLPVR